MKTLSLNGGGTSGYMTLGILQKIEEELKMPSYQLFDLITGVSTGSIISSFLCLGVTAKEVKQIYTEHIPFIFSNRNKYMIWKPYYKIEKLNDLAKKYLDITFKSSLKSRLMIYATKIDKPLIEPRFWKSWREENKDVKLSDAITASCAAPVYFQPYKFSDGVFVDGGLITNNPSVCAISEAIRLGANINNLYNLNISCGGCQGFDNAEDLKAIWNWALDIQPVMFYSNQKAVEYQAHQLINFRNHVVEPQHTFYLDSLDFEAMDLEVEKMWKLHRIAIIENLTIS